MEAPRLILASNSPRRQEYLGRLGLPFAVRVAAVEEVGHPGESPGAMVARLARAKAEAVALEQDELVVAADTVVIVEDEVLGKPADAADARRMLEALRGRSHLVHTGLALRRPGECRVEVVTAEVVMRPYSAAEVEAYIATWQPLDKAGAYGIQDQPFAPVERLEGCYMTVVGLPLCHVAKRLLTWGVSVPSLPAEGCRQMLGRPCPVALF